MLNTVKDGRGYVISVDGELAAPDARQCFETEDGDTLVVVTPGFTEENSHGYPDKLTISEIVGETATTWTAAYQIMHEGQVRNTGSMGAMLSEPVTSDGAWAYADRPPVFHSQWGTSIFHLIAPLVLEAAIRLSSRSTTLDVHEYPKLWVDASKIDLASIVSEHTDQHENLTEAQYQTALAKLLGFDLIYSAESSPPQIVQASVDVAASNMQLEYIKQELRMLSGVVSALEGEGQMPSGRAMLIGDRHALTAVLPIHGECAPALCKVAPECVWPAPYNPQKSDQPTENTEDVVPSEEEPDDGRPDTDPATD